MAETGVSVQARNQATMGAVVFAAFSLVLFALAVTTVLGEWAYPASMAAGVVAVVLGVLARRRGGADVRLATTALAVGAVLVVLQLAWLVAELLGLIEDTT